MGEPQGEPRGTFRRRTARQPETTQGADGNYVGGDLRQEFTINVGTAADAKKVLGTSRTPSRRTILLGGATLAATAERTRRRTPHRHGRQEGAGPETVERFIRFQ